MVTNPYSPPSTATNSERVEPNSGVETLYRMMFWSCGLIVLGFVNGLVTRMIRPTMNSGGVHWDAVIGLVWMAVLGLIAVFRFRKLPTAQALAWIAATIGVAWVAEFVGWTMMHDKIWDDKLFVSCVCSVIYILVACGLVAIINWRQKRHAEVGDPTSDATATGGGDRTK